MALSPDQIESIEVIEETKKRRNDQKEFKESVFWI